MDWQSDINSMDLNIKDKLQRSLERRDLRERRAKNRSPRFNAIRNLTHRRQQQTRKRLEDLRKTGDLTLSNIKRSQITDSTFAHDFTVTTKEADDCVIHIETKISKSTSLWIEIPELCQAVTDRCINFAYDTCDDAKVPAGSIKQTLSLDNVTIQLDLCTRSACHIEAFSDVLGALCGDFIANNRAYNLAAYRFTIHFKGEPEIDGQYTVSMPQSRLHMSGL